MNRRWRRSVVLFIAVAAVLLLLPMSPACSQSAEQVTIREPGHRMLGEPQPIVNEASNLLDFARLSEAVYERTPDGSAEAAQRQGSGCPEPHDALRRSGWTMWTDFPPANLKAEVEASHLRVEVWSQPGARPRVAVAFGGTEFKNLKDWMSNLRWFIPIRNDEYTQIVKQIAPAFVDAFAGRAAQPAWAYLKDATVSSTGHSLGGGLAQQFAYALPLRAPRRVTQVFAFDPSPVTGFYSVAAEVRDVNKTGLLIDRIYERDEILASVRSVLAVVYPPSAADPSLRGVRFNAFDTRNPLSGHSIAELACRLGDAAARGRPASGQ